MMSVSPGMSAGQAGGYFSKEDYYLRDSEVTANSRWCGRGTEALGLEGPVGEEEFRALCRGEAPQGVQIVAPRLTRDKESGALVATHRAGNDCTFSAPKSVSIAYAAGVDAVKEAHDAAVLAVLGHLEEHYGHYRGPAGIRNGGMVAAKFDHATSRNIDPQLHSHVFLINAVRTPDGSWRANEPRAVFQDQKSLGLLYRQALARELSARGMEVVILDRSQMFIELKGIDARLVEHFSSRRQAIERQVEEWRSKGEFTAVPHARLYEMAALESRDAKRHPTKEEVALTFERGFAACGTCMEAVRKELTRGREPQLCRPPSETSRVVELAIRDLTEREAVIERAALLDQAVRVSGYAHSLAELNAAIDGGAGGVLRLGQDARGCEYYTTKEMLALESRNLQRIRELPPFESTVTVPEVEAYLERLAGEGVRLTAGQKAEVLNELTGSMGATLSLGDPGTAKTSTLKIVERFNEEVLRPAGREHLSINLSYTGKAARELTLATGRPAFTLDSFENGNPASKFALQRANGEPSMVEVADKKILIPQGEGAQVVIRVDEAGFLGARQAERLLDVVEELGQSGVRVKLHLLGDSKQMQGIQAGDLLRQVRELGVRNEVDYAHLTEILRQRDPGLLEIAKGLNREDRALSENAREALAALSNRHELIEIADLIELRKAAVERYLEESRMPSLLPERAAAGERQTVLMVAATNAERRELNREVRSARIAAGEIGEGAPFRVLTPVRQGITVEGYQIGDTVHFSGVRGVDGRVQSWGARLGTEGRVTGIDRERNLVEVSYSFEGRKDGEKVTRDVVKKLDAAEMAGKTTLLREEERNFAVGDRVVALKNDARLDLQNGTLGTIRELDENGRAVIDFEKRRVTLDLTRYRQVDHAYAVTIHKSQGATVEHAIMFAAVQPERAIAATKEIGLESGEKQYGRASYNALNVAVTRAQFGVHLFTNSVEELARSVESVDTKSSSLSKSHELALEGEGYGMRKTVPSPSPGLAEKVGKLERLVHAPGDGMRRLNLERLQLPSISAPAHEPKRPLREMVPLQKEVAKRPELALVKKLGMELER